MLRVPSRQFASVGCLPAVRGDACGFANKPSSGFLTAIDSQGNVAALGQGVLFVLDGIKEHERLFIGVNAIERQRSVIRDEQRYVVPNRQYVDAYDLLSGERGEGEGRIGGIEERRVLIAVEAGIGRRTEYHQSVGFLARRTECFDLQHGCLRCFRALACRRQRCQTGCKIGFVGSKHRSCEGHGVRLVRTFRDDDLTCTATRVATCLGSPRHSITDMREDTQIQVGDRHIESREFISVGIAVYMRSENLIILLPTVRQRHNGRISYIYPSPIQQT